MSITVKYSTLRNPEFMNTMANLSRFKGLKNFETVHRIHLICKSLDPVLRDVAELHTKLVDMYAKKDEDGRLVPANNQPGTYVIDETKTEEWFKDLKSFDDTEVTLLCKKIRPKNLDEVGLSPREVGAIIDFLEV